MGSILKFPTISHSLILEKVKRARKKLGLFLVQRTATGNWTAKEAHV
jgi:hypothetical protein